MMGWSPPNYIPSYVEIGPPVPEKKIFEGFLPYMGVAAILIKHILLHIKEQWDRTQVISTLVSPLPKHVQ